MIGLQTEQRKQERKSEKSSGSNNLTDLPPTSNCFRKRSVNGISKVNMHKKGADINKSDLHVKADFSSLLPNMLLEPCRASSQLPELLLKAMFKVDKLGTIPTPFYG